MPDIFITIIAFIILIGVLVFIHELGHFLAARWTGMRAEVFAVGMGPRLFGWNRINGFTFGKLSEEIELGENTDYRISAFPIGGYVKILGMIDESMDTDFATSEPEPWEFRSKNTFQKAFVLSAGVIMNILLAIVLFAGLKFFHGEEIWNTTTIGTLSQEGATAAAYEAGLRRGDQIATINGEKVENFQEVYGQIYGTQAGEDLTFQVEREGMPMSISVPRSKIPANPDKQGSIVIPDNLGVAVTSVLGASPAYDAELQPEDVILALDGRHVGTIQEFITYVSEHTSEPITLTVQRGSSEFTKVVTPDEDGKLGVGIEMSYTGPKSRETYGVGAALVAGVGSVTKQLTMMVDLIGDLFSGKQKLNESVAGPVEIFKMAGKTFSDGPIWFLTLMASLSVMLAFMNILPIPALDGGHLVFVFIEGIMRREVPLKVRIAAQQAGFLILMAFMVFVFYNDFTR
ncbi:MAG: RIP metalloprotease RseP [Ignavibacteriae bacterium]|nr:RIP metalloprotease RseP [Ignavibacteriota bacterium]MCB9215336.1 RIP metalloprotease RseP [Ignavibacteria bacterium]